MRDKHKWANTPADYLYSDERRLPYFGIEVTRSDPQSHVVLKGETFCDEVLPDSSDAFSISYLHESGNATTVNRRYMDLDPAYIRRLLLQILNGEEYATKIKWHFESRRPRRELKPGVPKGKPSTLANSVSDYIEVEDWDPKAQVRITDLRLAKDLRPKDFARELKAELSGLHLPVTVDGVLRWKWETLRKPKGMKTFSDLIERPEWSQEEEVRTMAISFAAAAICLFVDLDLKNLEVSKHDDLAKRIIELHKVIKRLITELDRSGDQLSRLLAGRTGTKGGRPPDPDFKDYTALVLYRMGLHPTWIAERIDISTPRSPKRRKAGIADENWRFNDNWKNQLVKKIEKGIKIEQERYPAAAEVFARRDEEEIREEALADYHEYNRRYDTWPLYMIDVLGDGDDLLNPTTKREQKQNALIQLGCCISRGIDPLSPKL